MIHWYVQCIDAPPSVPQVDAPKKDRPAAVAPVGDAVRRAGQCEALAAALTATYEFETSDNESFGNLLAEPSIAAIYPTGMGHASSLLGRDLKKLGFETCRFETEGGTATFAVGLRRK